MELNVRMGDMYSGPASRLRRLMEKRSAAADGRLFIEMI